MPSIGQIGKEERSLAREASVEDRMIVRQAHIMHIVRWQGLLDSSEQLSTVVHGLWHDLIGDQKVPSRSRCQVVNLVAVCHSSRQLDEAEKEVLRLSARHPARLLVLGLYGRRASEVAIVSSSGHHGLTPACEWVAQQGIGFSDLPDLEDFMASWLNPDLPTLLRDYGDPSEMLNSAVINSLDAVVYDSRLAVPATFLRRCRSLGNLPLVDMAWIALEPLRRAVALVFEDPARVRDLHCLKDVTVSAGDEMSALLILGWLAASLDADLAADGSALRTAASEIAATQLVRKQQRASIRFGFDNGRTDVMVQSSSPSKRGEFARRSRSNPKPESVADGLQMALYGAVDQMYDAVLTRLGRSAVDCA